MSDKYFAYDSGSDGFETFETEDEARESARKSIELYREDSDQRWPDEVDTVCYGKIIAVAKGKIINQDEPPCGGKVCCADCDKEKLAEGIKDDDVCEDYDSDNDGEEYADYTLEPLETVVPPGITGKCREYEVALLEALEWLEMSEDRDEAVIGIIKKALGG